MYIYKYMYVNICICICIYIHIHTYVNAELVEADSEFCLKAVMKSPCMCV